MLLLKFSSLKLSKYYLKHRSIDYKYVKIKENHFQCIFRK
ncbi:hypothetical protein THALO_290095 [Tenacibaculum halocynthiae]